MIRIREAILVEGRYDVNTVRQVVDTVVLESGGLPFSTIRNSSSCCAASHPPRTDRTDRQRRRRFCHPQLPQGRPPCGKRQAGLHPGYCREGAPQAPCFQRGQAGRGGQAAGNHRAGAPRAGATFADETAGEQQRPAPITKADLFAWGLSGGPDSARRRAAVLRALDLPSHMTANALLEFINAVGTRKRSKPRFAICRKKGIDNYLSLSYNRCRNQISSVSGRSESLHRQYTGASR